MCLLFGTEYMMRKLCEELEIEYTNKMIEWEPLSDPQLYKDFEGFFNRVMETSGFKASKTDAKTNKEVYSELPREVQGYVDDNMGFYEILHQARIQPPNL